MSNCFSSLENLSILLNNLVNTNKDATPLKYINRLVNDLTIMLNESDFYDMEIRVGVDQGIKTFKAHSNILKARSPYFKAALSNDWVKKSEDGSNILFEKENISPSIFEVLLTYIYNGIIDIDNMNPNEIVELLEACDELNFDELIEDLQNYLIKQKEEWIQRNVVYFYEFSSRHQSFIILQDYFKKLINDIPELMLEFDDIAIIDKSILVSILEKDNLELDEIKIWDYIIQWGIVQVENLDETNILEWNENDFIELKNILKDIIPLMRFNQISKNDFYDKIKPYEKVFNKELYEELLQYHLTNKWQPNLLLQKGPRTEKGKLLSSEVKYLISSWIDYKNDDDLYNNKNDLPYKFKLILCGSEDGFTRPILENKCYNIEQTLVIMKIKETGELVGGYNPVCWNLIEKSLNDKYYIETDQSFIFKIDESQINNSVLSRIHKPKYAIYHDRRYITFTEDNIKFNDILLDFTDLQLFKSITSKLYCYYSFYNDAQEDFYENNLNLVKNNSAVHLLEDFEVYKVVKRK